MTIIVCSFDCSMLVILSIQRSHVLSIQLNRTFETESGVTIVHNRGFAVFTKCMPVWDKIGALLFVQPAQNAIYAGDFRLTLLAGKKKCASRSV